MTDKKLLENFIGSVERIAFSMAPPNEYTPRFVGLCQEARTVLLSDDALGGMTDKLTPTEGQQVVAMCEHRGEMYVATSQHVYRAEGGKLVPMLFVDATQGMR